MNRMTIRTALLGTLLLVGCGGGPREAGAVPGQTVYWKVVSSEVSFGACTDDPQFRDQIRPVAFEENSYFVYRVSGDGKTAATQDCKTFSASSCVDSDPGLSFDLAGNELNLSRDLPSDIGDGGCQLQTSQQWVGQDMGTALVLDVSNTMSLVNAPTECDRIEANVKASSPNGLGFQGCVVTYKLGFSHP